MEEQRVWHRQQTEERMNPKRPTSCDHKKNEANYTKVKEDIIKEEKPFKNLLISPLSFHKKCCKSPFEANDALKVKAKVAIGHIAWTQRKRVGKVMNVNLTPCSSHVGTKGGC